MVAIGNGSYQPIREYDVAAVRSSIESKLIDPLLLAPGDSIVFRSGMATMAARLPVGRIGRTKDIADAIIALLRNGFITGTVLHADGGHRLV
jgi:NAD(P)-dependent dehydrogenase (short-subunit alcohol dehydrogenase family)